MPFSLSPSVEFTETDLTLSIPAVATSVGAIAGYFMWGPVEQPSTIIDESQLVAVFGKPTDDNYKDWFSAANFLSYSNSLKVVRTVGTGAVNADDGTAANINLIKNKEDFDSQYSTLNTSIADGTDPGWFARYPGTFGNRITVRAVDSNGFAGWAFANLFEFEPDGLNEMCVVVLLNNDQGVDEVVETFFVSKDPEAVESAYNKSMFIDDVINAQSQYVYVVSGTGLNSVTAGATLGNEMVVTFAGGTDANPSDGDVQAGWAQFLRGVDVNLLISGGATTATNNHSINGPMGVANARKDCVAFISPQEGVFDQGTDSAIESALINDANNYTSSNYCFVDGNYKQQYDTYNDVMRWIPLNGDMAGLCARTDYTNDPWWSPAGFNRGFIKGVEALAWNPAKANRDSLYQQAINPIIIEPGEGAVLLGDKTFVKKPSAFGYINVRRLFIVLEKAISTAAKYQLFEFNDTFTQNRFVSMVEPYLRDVKGRRGIYDFLVVADGRVNTGEVIDRGEFKSNIYIKPARSIQNIYLNFIATKTGVVFEELIAN